MGCTQEDILALLETLDRPCPDPTLFPDGSWDPEPSLRTSASYRPVAELIFPEEFRITVLARLTKYVCR